MPLKAFIERLEIIGMDYRQTGPDSYLSCCPAHRDKSPSLSIKGLPDGRVLLHCFAGCSWDEILFVMDMEPKDIMPANDNYKPLRSSVKAGESRFINDMTLLIAQSALDRGERLSESDKEAVLKAKLDELKGTNRSPWE